MDPYRHTEALRRGTDEELARNALGRELTREEEFLWAGRPKQGLYIRRSDLVAVPFSLVWAGFAIFWEIMVITTGAPFFFKLWGLPFVAVGLHMVFGRFFFDARTRARTFCAVTNRRALILVVGRTRNLLSIDLADAGELFLEEWPDGSGTISIGAPRAPVAGIEMWPNARKQQQPPTLERIADARGVFNAMLDVQQEQRKSRDGERKAQRE